MTEGTTKGQIEQELDEIEAMFVQTAVESSAEGNGRTLHDIGVSTLYFSDRPKWWVT
jgi:hypothetical protein